MKTISRFLTLACFLLLLGTNASADVLAPCSPTCMFTDAYSIFTIAMPDTAFTYWDGPIEELPLGIFAFGIFSTPARDDLSLTSSLSEAYAFNAFDLSEPIRHARRNALQNWANYENGIEGWSRDGNGVLSFADPAPVTNTENPEPPTVILMVTGVIGLILFARRKNHLRRMTISSQ